MTSDSGKSTVSGTGGVATTGAKGVSLSAHAKGTYGVTDEHARCLGHLFVKASQIEGTLEVLIWHLAKLDPPVGKLFTEYMDFRHQVERFDQLLRVPGVPPTTMPLWKEAKSLIKKVAEHRKDFAHSIVIRFGGPALLMSTRRAAFGSVYGPPKPITPRQTEGVNAEADRVLQLLKEIDNLV